MEKEYDTFIPCEEAQHTCDKSQYGEASLFEKIRLNIHLIYCKACRNYTAKNIKLTKLVTDKKVQIMNTNEREDLEALFKKELSKND